MKVRGVELTLHEDEALSNHIRRERDFFEAPILDYVSQHHHSHGVIIDVGANIGNHTVYFAKFLKYDAIVAIEPIPANFALLLSNIRDFPNIVAIPVAVGDEEKRVPMMQKRDNMGASKIVDSKSANIDDVPMFTLDSFKFVNVSLIKIDVEGYEAPVLRGAKETIEKWHPLLLIEEWTPEELKVPEGYVLEQGWENEYTYLYRWQG